MAHTEYNTVGNGIRAQDVHDLTQEVLQAHWPLEMEKSYRLMNSVRARTASTSVTLRLLLVAVAFLLLNLWSYVKWMHLFVPKRGPRQTLHHLLPLARWRLWLWEMVKQHLGFSLSVAIPLSA